MDTPSDVLTVYLILGAVVWLLWPRRTKDVKSQVNDYYSRRQ